MPRSLATTPPSTQLAGAVAAGFIRGYSGTLELSFPSSSSMYDGYV